MNLLVNDLSLHGQFQDPLAFHAAISRVLGMRNLARSFGRSIHCPRTMVNRPTAPGQSLFQAVQLLKLEEKRSLMVWLTQSGPFWDDSRTHGSHDYLESKGDVVTDTAVGEAAFSCLSGIDRQLLSLAPSAWEFSPVPVTWFREASTKNIGVANYWDYATLEVALQATPAPIASCEQLADVARTRCPNLMFSPDSFAPLRGHPYVDGAAQGLLVRFEILQRFRMSVDQKGKRTAEGQRLYQDHFTGDKAWFSDSSDAEKNDFRKDLTFRRPDAPGDDLFCPWHAKIKTPQFRIHFSWPIPAAATLYVVYVGPKITKR